MDSSTDRSAQVAHVLHGTRQAVSGEPGCAGCGVLLCAFCVMDEVLCAPCYERELYEREAEREEAKREWEALERGRHAESEEEDWWKKHYGY